LPFQGSLPKLGAQRTKSARNRNNMTSTRRLEIGGILFAQMDQADFTGPFEVLSRIPNSTFHVLARDKGPIRDAKGLVLTPEMTFAEAPQFDVLLVAGGFGVDAVMEDQPTLEFIRRQAKDAKLIFSVCTGALVLGAAGLLKRRQATTHWASFHLLEEFGAIPVNARVVYEPGSRLVTTAGVTAGIEGALKVASLLRGDAAAQEIQLYIQYAPEPPFNSGTPESAPPEIVAAMRASMRERLDARLGIIQRVVARVR
jgi:cyclohexyl-isocyanide hydratase